MKNWLIRIFCFMMSFQVLFASTGLTVTEHLCKFKGRQIFLFSSPKTCCAQKIVPTQKVNCGIIKPKKCCEDHISKIKISTSSSHGASIDFKINPLVSISTPFSWSFNASYLHFFETFSFFKSSPPLAGINLLIFIQSFLI
ncbi:HYC_CC_PP family protein [Arcicella lustrica]|uniref:HYC_CC_PP family protein n=1 Tax=Arcicella lustrica TaxID=2984196 RepID=UPI0038990525